ncbi:MAG: hypothetical protein QOH17_1927 [Pseudonocardiales bacterium]|nr:hypothetical protein [Pseudonocardiales bacterium]
MISGCEALQTAADPTAAGMVNSGFTGAYGMYSQLQNEVLSHSYSDVLLIGIASLAGMVLAFFLPGRRRS